MFFQIKKEEDVILDCDLGIVINNDGNVDGVMSFTEEVQIGGDDDEGGRHGVNGCHVVNGIEGG